MQNIRTVLVAGLGTSPAVLTETIWALAHQVPSVVPDEVVVLTTQTGQTALCREILAGEASIWKQMCDALHREEIDIRGKLVFGDTSIRIIPDAQGNGIEDLRSGEDNLRAADFMLQQLRQYTECPDTIVLTSIAGGRKTMSALLFSCMTLLGREQDKVFHVLLPPEFESGVEPKMYYPVKGVTYRTRSGQVYSSDRYTSELFEVPFVRMRGWYQEKFKSVPPSYRTLIAQIQTVAPPAIAYPEIEMDVWNGWVKVDGRPVSLSRTCFAVLLLLATGCAAKDLHTRLVALHASTGQATCDWLSSFREGSRFSDPNCTEDLNKTMSELRKRLKAAGFDHADMLVPQRSAAVTFPLSRVLLRNEKLLDIRRLLKDIPQSNEML